MLAIYFFFQVATLSVDWSNSLGWDKWKLHYGNQEGIYSGVIDAQLAKVADVKDLDISKKWCFAVQGYSSQAQSPLSDPLCVDLSSFATKLKEVETSYQSQLSDCNNQLSQYVSATSFWQQVATHENKQSYCQHWQACRVSLEQLWLKCNKKPLVTEGSRSCKM